MIIFAICGTLFTILCLLKWRYAYWKRKKMPFLPPRLLFGNVQNPCTRDISPSEEYKLFYNTIKLNGWKHAGIYSFTTPVYVPIDLEYIKNILAKDFYLFDERGRYYNEKDDPISAHLFNIGGTKWRGLRKKFTPTFSSAKLRNMFDNLLECGKTLEDAAAEYAMSQQPVEVKRLSKNFTVEVIGLCVFGVHFNSFCSHDSEILVQVAKFLKGNLMEAARMILTFSFPELSKFLKIPRYDKEATEFFTNFITELVLHRETKNIRQNDFLQLLIDLKNCESMLDGDTKLPNKNEQQAITMEELIAQAMIFLVAGYDSSASTIALALFELSSNIEMQEKLRTEINNTIKNTGGKFTYEGMGELKYMEQIINETLRKYPPLAILNRQSNSDYKIPDSNIVLDKGTPIVISLLGLHYDSRYFPNPDKFDPERFSPENITKIKPFSYLPFGEGPKGCLGARFGMLNSKMALCVLLKKFKYTLNSKTKTPFEFDLGILNNVKGGIWLNIQKLS